ncbi:MAG: RES family NAD+ phosphorylase [Chitinophagaceae bacterium]|nr:RES family NAD+ phosphorylase [Chitinophagaceae bacterium]
MRLYRIAACEHINDLTGTGSFLHGGRWNSKGVHLLYTAESSALSMLEALAHITMANAIRDYCRVVMEFSDAGQYVFEHLVKELKPTQLPTDWRSSPGPDALKMIGDAFVQEGKFFALKTPSVLEPDSFNYLLNPRHPAFSAIKVISSDRVSFDLRLLNRK